MRISFNMTKTLQTILQSLSDSNYLKAQCVWSKNQKLHCRSSLLKNGLKLRYQLLNQWQHATINWAKQYAGIQQNKEIKIGDKSRVSFLQNIEFQKSYHHICKQNLVDSSNSIALKTIYNNVVNFVSEEDLFCGSDTKTLLVSDFFVAAVSQLSKYYNLQRERKIWWMRFSANAGRYWVEPFDICLKEDEAVREKCKSITIRAKFPFGLVDMESITLVPLCQLSFSNLSNVEELSKISLIRSVINLDLTTYDASKCRTQNTNNALMLHRKLAPYQVLLASLHRGNKIVDELTLHLEHVVRRSGLRLYDKILHADVQTELEKQLINFNSLGIPYTLVVDYESSVSGLIKLRSRDTTLFETIHISDIPNYLFSIFKQ